MQCSRSASRCFHETVGMRDGATVTLKLKQVSCDLLRICQEGCNDFRSHWERLNKFQAVTILRSRIEGISVNQYC